MRDCRQIGKPLYFRTFKGIFSYFLKKEPYIFILHWDPQVIQPAPVLGVPKVLLISSALGEITHAGRDGPYTPSPLIAPDIRQLWEFTLDAVLRWELPRWAWAERVREASLPRGSTRTPSLLESSSWVHHKHLMDLKMHTILEKCKFITHEQSESLYPLPGMPSLLSEDRFSVIPPISTQMLSPRRGLSVSWPFFTQTFYLLKVSSQNFSQFVYVFINVRVFSVKHAGTNLVYLSLCCSLSS